MLPKPSPLDAPFTKPAISTNDIVVLIIFLDFDILAKLFNLISGTYSDAAVKNLIQLKFISASECWYTISQIAT